ncbi:Restriction endonuclease subunit R [Tumidithrix helvetica PCC 7403]|uniref:restriction endonuclease subunit R n=1 Tax=Tumidithrix helvetica TaxID=3457545 RepID=UPI003CA4F8C6
MTTLLQAKNLTLGDVQRLFGFKREAIAPSFASLLCLEPLTEFERQELAQIQEDFDNYLAEGKVSEGQVKFLVIAPLMKLAGFYKSPLAISLEEDIAEIEITDLDTTIKGRMDILAVKKALSKAEAAFWVLVIEAKNSEIAALTGLPQLLTYAYKSLENQPTVWGLTTNGVTYQFVYLSQGNSPIYQLLPDLSLINSERSLQLLQVLKAICALIAA